jgi:AcrR family transcriptional regulator
VARATTPRRGRPPNADSDSTRKQVVTAARRAFARHGYAGATMRGIAAEAGLTVMALYHYASSKEALFDLVFKEGIGDIYAEYERVVAGASTLVDEIDALLDHTRTVLLDRPEHTLLTLRALVDREQAGDTHLDLWEGAVASFFIDLADRAAARGEISLDERADLVSLLSTLLWGITAINAHEPTALARTIDAAKWSTRRQFAPRPG